MNLQTFIITGRSGCGKGTQSKLLREYIEAHDDQKQPILYVETGDRFREFIKGTSFSSTLAEDINKNGERQPDFLAIWNWAHVLVESLTGKEHLMFDGTPRSTKEAMVLDTAMKFYNRTCPVVIHLNVSREWSRKHLLSRGRGDDKSIEVDKRLAWFETEVLPAIEYYKNSPDYTFIEINGEQLIEKVHTDIMQAWSN